MEFKINQKFDRKTIEELAKLAYSIRFQHVKVYRIQGSDKQKVLNYLNSKNVVFENQLIKTLFNEEITFSTQSDKIMSLIHNFDDLDFVLEEVKSVNDEHGDYFITLVERLKALSKHTSDTDILLATIIAESELGKLLDNLEYERLYGHFNDKFIQTMMNYIIEISYVNDIDLLNKVILEGVLNIEFYIFSDDFDDIIKSDYQLTKLNFFR